MTSSWRIWRHQDETMAYRVNNSKTAANRNMGSIGHHSETACPEYNASTVTSQWCHDVIMTSYADKFIWWIAQKRLQIDTWLHWGTIRKPYTAGRMAYIDYVTMTSWWRIWRHQYETTAFVWITQTRLQIGTWLQSDTIKKPYTTKQMWHRWRQYDVIMALWRHTLNNLNGE